MLILFSCGDDDLSVTFSERTISATISRSKININPVTATEIASLCDFIKFQMDEKVLCIDG